MSKPEEPLELQSSKKPLTEDGCGVCHPPEDVGMNHRPFPRLLDIITQSDEHQAKR